MDGMFAVASPSVSSLYGNVTFAVREYLLSQFPPHFFQYVATSTEFAYENIRRQFGGTNSNIEFKKRRYPQLIIQPAFQEPERDSFLQGIPLTSNFDNLQLGIVGMHMMSLIKDPKYQYNLQYRINRDRIEFECRLVLSTLHQQLDIFKAMQNMLIWERSFTRITSLECVIPRTIIRYIGKLCELDIDEHEYTIPMLLQRMNKMSSHPITYKLRNASATDEFFMYYNHQMILTLYDLHLDDGQKKQMVDDHYDITFRVSADFNLPGMFALTGNPGRLTDLKETLKIDGSTIDGYNAEVIPLYTVNNAFAKYPPEIGDFKLVGSTRFKCDAKPDGKPDTLDIMALFSLEQRKVIQFYTEYNLPPENVIQFILLKDNEELHLEDVKINWHDLQLEILQPDDEATYRCIVYVNYLILNTVLADLHEYDAFDKAPLKHFPIDYQKKKEDSYPFIHSRPSPDHQAKNEEQP